MKFKVEGYVHSASLTISDEYAASFHCCYWLEVPQLERLRDDISVALREIDANQQKISKEAGDWAEKEAEVSRA